MACKTGGRGFRLSLPVAGRRSNGQSLLKIEDDDDRGELARMQKLTACSLFAVIFVFSVFSPCPIVGVRAAIKVGTNCKRLKAVWVRTTRVGWAVRRRVRVQAVPLLLI